MALHPEFPESPYDLLRPDHRWFPAAEELRATAYEKLLPPLVPTVRCEVKAWWDSGYAGSSAASGELLFGRQTDNIRRDLARQSGSVIAATEALLPGIN